jgi:hypothetical protein
LRKSYSEKLALQINRLGNGWQPSPPIRIDESAAARGFPPQQNLPSSNTPRRKPLSACSSRSRKSERSIASHNE